MIDYPRYFGTSTAIHKELEALNELNPHKDNFLLRKPSKREARLIRMYWILRKREDARRIERKGMQ